MDIKALKRDNVLEVRLRGSNFVFHTTWGLFSPREIDEGARLLIEHMEVNAGDACLDLGCGYGPIGLAMARLSGTGAVYLVDKDFVAVEYARRNAELNHISNCEALLSNAFDHLPRTKFDVIASNLPANVGKELLNIILLEAREYLKPNGRFYVVTIAGLREFIKRNFGAIFGNYERVKQGRNHTVALAVKTNCK
jgi:16S rRNA G1207 methylase RsmC